MHIKKNNIIKTKNFIQGLRPLSNSIPHGLKKIIKKNGYNFSNIVDNWSKMVGKEISAICYPSNVKMNKSTANGILILNVIHGKEIDVEYQKKTILDKINSFFGYNCISELKLKVVQEQKSVLKKLNSHKDKNINFEKKLEMINNDNLKKTLNNLIKAYNAKND